MNCPCVVFLRPTMFFCLSVRVCASKLQYCDAHELKRPSHICLTQVSISLPSKIRGCLLKMVGVQNVLESTKYCPPQLLSSQNSCRHKSDENQFPCVVLFTNYRWFNRIAYIAQHSRRVISCGSLVRMDHVECESSCCGLVGLRCELWPG